MTGAGSGQIEFANRARLIGRLFECGFGVYIPVIDEGIDLIAYRESDGAFKALQLKSRWTIDKKYIGRSIWIAFPDDQSQDWFLCPHDEMVAIGEQRGYCETKSWTENGVYHLAPISSELRLMMAERRISLGL